MNYSFATNLKSVSIPKLLAKAALASALVFTLATVALANSCKETIDVVTKARITSNLPARDNAKIDTAIEAALAKHSTGDTEGCLAELVEAKAMLNLA